MNKPKTQKRTSPISEPSATSSPAAAVGTVAGEVVTVAGPVVVAFPVTVAETDEVNVVGIVVTVFSAPVSSWTPKLVGASQLTARGSSRRCSRARARRHRQRGACAGSDGAAIAATAGARHRSARVDIDGRRSGGDGRRACGRGRGRHGGEEARDGGPRGQDDGRGHAVGYDDRYTLGSHQRGAEEEACPEETHLACVSGFGGSFGCMGRASSVTCETRTQRIARALATCK